MRLSRRKFIEAVTAAAVAAKSGLTLGAAPTQSPVAPPTAHGTPSYSLSCSVSASHGEDEPGWPVTEDED